MNRKLSLITWVVAVGLIVSASSITAQGQAPLDTSTTQTALGTGFTYQGQLKNASGPVNGACDLRFSLWDAAGSGSPPVGGAQVGITQTLALTVTNGLFTVVLNGGNEFGNNAFTGDARWLQIAVRCPASSSGAYSTLSPRQPITPAPYAFGLKPGAIISGTASTPLLSVVNTNWAGVHGKSGSGNGVEGFSTAFNASGVYGENMRGEGYGVAGRATGYGSGVYGENGDSLGYAGAFAGNVFVSGHELVGGNVFVTGNQSFGYTMRQMINLGSTQYGIGVQSSTMYFRTESIGGFAWHQGGAHSDQYNDPGPGGKTLMTLNSGGTLSVTGTTGHGVIGNGIWSGVVGSTSNAGGAGVYGANFAASSGSGAGVQGYSYYNPGIVAESLYSDPLVAYGGTPGDREFYVSNAGNVYADGTYNTPAADFAELLPAASGLEPGDVLVIDLDGKLIRSTRPHQSNVVGVYSTRPGFLGGAGEEADLTTKAPLAIVGIVPVKVTAENGSIRPGDRLVASSRAGHAMRAGENPPSGAVIGKALGGLESGTGVIQMLVMLQ